MNVERKSTLSVVLPAYNEGCNLEICIKRLVRELEKIGESYEIIIVNDGSRDDTKAKAVTLKKRFNNIIIISYMNNKGKGYAIRRGINASVGKYVVIMDADLDIHPYQIALYLRKFKEEHKNDIRVAGVIGSKFEKNSKVDFTAKRRVMSMVYYKMLQLMFHFDLKDTNTGLKLFSGDLVRSAVKNMVIDGFAYDIELVDQIYKQGYRLKSAPIVCGYTRTGKDRNRIKIKHIKDTFLDTMRVYKNDTFKRR